MWPRLPLVLVIIALTIEHSVGLDCEGAAKWSKEDLIRPVGKRPPPSALSAAELSAARSLTEVRLECLGVVPVRLDSAAAAQTRPEGDLNFGSTKDLLNFVARSNRPQKSALGAAWRRWPNGRVPYSVDGAYGPYSRSVIASAINYIQDNSCLKFVDRNSERDYVNIWPDEGGGCYSYVGRTGGRQNVSIDNGCISRGTITHELLHALGFFHEQSRPDRDEYVEIVWENLSGWLPGLPRELQSSDILNQFAKYEVGQMASLSVGYDYGSILHYGAYAYSGNGKATIVGRKSGKGKMGQREIMSQKDIAKLNSLYDCPDRKLGPEIKPEIFKPSRPAEPENECSDHRFHTWLCRWWVRLPGCGYYIVSHRCQKSCGLC